MGFEQPVAADGPQQSERMGFAVNTPNGNVIQTQGLSKTYKGVAALQGLNLCVPRNSIYGFLGPNGAGKSTTIKLLLGLAKPTSGSASLFGLDSVRDSVAIRQQVGYLAQDPRYYAHLTARETLRYAARFFYSGPADLIEARIAETLELVGLADKADRPIAGFSGGERQRLGIAQAQVNYPDLLILDEPAAALDPMGRRDVLEVMQRLRKHTTVFYSTHILEDVQRVSDRVAILNRGRLIAEAPIDELLGGGEVVTYVVQLASNGARRPEEALRAAQERVAAQPWVTALSATADSGATEWQVGVSDTDAAEASLAPLALADGHLRLKEFRRKQHNLEEVFVNLVEGGRS
jgi:ABC-2 type transport system ATP-binding protein